MSKHKDFNRPPNILAGGFLDAALNCATRNEVVESPPVSISEKKVDIKLSGTNKNPFLQTDGLGFHHEPI